MTEEQRRLVMELAVGRVSESVFRRQFDGLLPDDPQERARLLGAALASGDAEEVGCMRILCARFGSFTAENVEALCELLDAPWHTCHEDIAFALEQLHDERSIEALYRAALSKHEYLAYDDGHALARKCIWALAKIGTAAARRRLEDLSRCGDPTIEGYAKKRLDA